MKPYRNSREHIVDELRRLDLLISVHLEEWLAEHEGAVDEFRGLYVSDDEIARLLSSRIDDGHRADGGAATDHAPPGGDQPLSERVERLTTEIHERIQMTQEAGTELRLVELVDRFDLERRHRDALLVSLAPELDGRYERIYAYLHDDLTRTQPTVGLVLRILFRTEVERLAARKLFSPRSVLRSHRLLRLEGENGLLLPSRVVTVDDRIVDYLLGGDEVAMALDGVASYSVPERSISDLPVDESRRETLARLARTGADRRSKPLMAYFHGPYGSGKGEAVEALCATDGSPLVVADAQRIPRDELVETVELLIREARLQGGALHVKNFDSLRNESEADSAVDRTETGDAEAVLSLLDGFDDRVHLTATEPLAPSRQRLVDAYEFASVHFPTPTYERRKELWDDVGELPEEVDTADLAAKFRLTGGQIADAVSTAGTVANGQELSAESVYRGCRAQSRDTLNSLARKIEPNYTWNDIVLPADRLEHLREVAAHIKHQGTVYADWGFEDKFSLGNGLNVLFTGPSGTGKTMAAEIIAGDAGLDLYKIDLAGVVSKYIGETEKNLRKIFDEAENSDAILFFDEADALFGKRSEVKDSHDRYANIEVNYLLQRVEEHDGTVVLTTNFKGNIDDAFLRRIHLRVDFPPPDKASRAEIWRKVFPDETPQGGLDVDFLSGFEITGGNIKNIALTAAFLAADDGGAVEMEHVVRAAKREFQKTGKLIDMGEFGEYQGIVKS